MFLVFLIKYKNLLTLFVHRMVSTGWRQNVQHTVWSTWEIVKLRLGMKFSW